MTRQPLFNRRRRRSSLLVAVAVLTGMLAVPTSVGSSVASAEVPEIHATWRGWVAFENEDVYSGSMRHHYVHRSWAVDVDLTSADGEWAANQYRMHVSSTPCGQSGNEQAGSGTGATVADLGAPYEYGVTSSMGGGDQHGYPYGTPTINFGHYSYDGSFPVASQDFGCFGYSAWKDVQAGAMFYPTGGMGDYDNPPLTVANDVEWNEDRVDGGEIRRRAVVCMTRSSVDTDRDGLPDPVDLAPAEDGSSIDLGHPNGSQAWDQEVPAQFGGPSGTKGLPTCPADPADDRRVMVSLGDSYSSGEGVYGYDPATDVRGVNHCHRANSAYPRVGFRALSSMGSDLEEVQSFACSGAVALNLHVSEFCGSGCDGPDKEAPQLHKLRELEAGSSQVELVTLGIGGNDAGFADVIKGCVSPVSGNCVPAFEPTAGGELPAASPEEVAARVDTALTTIALDAPHADIVLVGYPVFISPRYKDCPTLVGAKGIGAEEAEWIRSQILYLNHLLAELVANKHPRAKFLSLEQAYGDNVPCNGQSAETQWVHGVVADTKGTAAQEEACIGTSIPLDVFKLPRVYICNESFHPKAEGHAATGAALAACVTTGDCGTVSNPYTKAPVFIADPPLLPCGHILCSLLPDEPVRVRASGFLPGRPVSIALHSRPVELLETVAGADGSVDVEVTLPAGVVPPGQHRLVLTGPGDDSIVRLAQTDVTVPCGSGFSDVAADHPFCGDVTWMRSTGVTSGYSDGTFQPGLGLSRAQMASFLWRLAGQPAVAASAPSFADVPAGSPHATAVRWLAARGITTGYPDGTFKPDLGLTRAHMAAFLHRFAGHPAPSASAPTFADVPADNQFATAISWLAGEGITLGKSDGTYGPADALNRQQMAAFLHRFGEPRGLPE